MRRRALQFLQISPSSFIVVLGLAIASASGQDYQKIAPKTPPELESPKLSRPAPVALPTMSDVSLSVVLKGLVFLRDKGLVSERSFTASSPAVDVSQMAGLTDAHFSEQFTPYLGHELKMSDLEAIRTVTINYFRARQKPFVDVSIPPQKITTGVIQVIVTEYKVGRIKVEGARYFSPSLIDRISGLQAGQTLKLDDLQSNLDRLNRNPFLNVDAVFQPGAQPSQTDIQLKAKDQFPLRVYSGFDNLGTRGLGTQEFNTGVNWGNAFGTGQILSYQFTRSLSGAYSSHSISDAIPLRWGDQVLIFGSYALQHPMLASIFNDRGHSGQASARYVHFLPRFHRLTQQIEAGYDFKTTDNTLEFAGFHVFGSEAEVNQFPLIYDATLPDRFGHTAFENTFVYSPGNLTPNNTTAALQMLVPGSKAAYFYNRSMITRTTPLPKQFSAVSRVTLQASDHNLPYSEQIGGGGVGSVRGYYTDTAFGSQGSLFSQEIRLPSFAPSRSFDRASQLPDRAQVGIFFDYADLRQVTPIPDMKNRVQLSSAGFLMRYSTSRFFDTEFDMGRRLRAAPTVPDTGWYGQVSLTGRF
jgi:hemolysin activation/secretion protein